MSYFRLYGQNEDIVQDKGTLYVARNGEECKWTGKLEWVLAVQSQEGI